MTRRGTPSRGFDPFALIPYVPNLVARRLASGRDPPNASEVERFPAATLFADISGFTPLAERLAREGAAGAEELSDRLNACFGPLVSIVLEQGGDVVKFAGDAILAIWTLEGNDLAEGTTLAARCALMLQEHLNASDLAGRAGLSMRIGIGAGDVSTALLGGSAGRWEFLVAGPATADAVRVGPLARPGDVIVSPSALALVGADGDIEPLAAGEDAVVPGFRLTALRTSLPHHPVQTRPSTQTAAASLTGFVPESVLAALGAGQSDWLSELRRVSACFLRIEGLEGVEGHALERSQAAMQAVEGLVDRYEGSVNKLSVDEKGVSLLVAFGLPPLAHEDDPARAVQATLDIEDALRTIPLPCSVGVATGRAFCGVVGSTERREYTLIGDVVNRAARLMQNADGDVLCDRATRHAAQARVAFGPSRHIRVKGRVESIEASVPIRGAQVQRRARSTVGRERERRLLADRVAKVRDGRGGVVLIQGEAGIGKSQLVEELLRDAEANGVAAFLGAGDAVESTTPYLAWRSVLEDVLELPRDAELRGTLTLEWLSGRPDLARVASLLNDVMPLDVPPTEVTRQMDGKVRADNTRTLLIGIIEQATAGGSIVLVLEDAHWLDPSSWAVASLVTQRLPQVLLVLALRPLAETPPEEYLRIAAAPDTEVLLVEPLAGEDTLALVRQRLGVRSVPRRVVDLILGRAEGNPFFTEELTYALRDAGTIVVEDGECRIEPGAALDELVLPETVEGAVTSRIDRLDTSSQLVLKVASVVGYAFGFGILRDIYPLPDEVPQLSGHLKTLQELDLTKPEALEPEPSWSFKHAITRDVAYNLMLFAQRRDLHRAAAEWYEWNHRHELPRFYPLLAHHWGHAEAASKEMEYRALAGEQALSSGACREAIVFMEQALSLEEGARTAGVVPEDRLRRARWQRQMGEAHLGLGQVAEARVHLTAGLQTLGFSAPTSRPRVLAGVARQVPTQILHRLFPRLLLERESSGSAELLEAARAYMRLVEVYWFANDVPSLVHAGFSALNRAERAGPSPELAWAYAIVCLSTGSIPIHRFARAYASRAIETAREVDQLWPMAYVRFLTSVYAIGTGAWEEIRPALDEAAKIFERLGDRRLLGDTRTVQAMSRLYRGDFASTEAIFRDVHDAGVRNENIQHQVWGLIGSAECALRRGGPEEASLALGQALALLGKNPDRAEQLRAHGLLAVARWRGGDRDGAVESASTATDLIRQFFSPTAHYLLEGYAGVGEVWLSLWESGDASREVRRAARKACKRLRKFAHVFPIGEPRAHLWTARYHRLSGRRRKARAKSDKSLTLAEQLNMRWEQALAHLEVARCLTYGEEDERRHVDRARELLRQMGLPLDDVGPM